MNADVKPARDFAAPPVVPGDSVRIARLDAAKQIFAERIAAVVRFAEPPQLAVRNPHRLNFRKELTANRLRPRARWIRRCRRSSNDSRPEENRSDRHKHGANP